MWRCNGKYSFIFNCHNGLVKEINFKRYKRFYGPKLAQNDLFCLLDS